MNLGSAEMRDSRSDPSPAMDYELPQASINRIIKNKLPDTAQVGRTAPLPCLAALMVLFDLIEKACA